MRSDEAVIEEIALMGGISSQVVRDVFRLLLVVLSMRFRDDVRPQISVPYLGNLLLTYLGERSISASSKESEVELFLAPSEEVKMLIGEILDEKRGAPYRRGSIFRYYEKRARMNLAKI